MFFRKNMNILTAKSVRKLVRKNFKGDELFTTLREICGTKYTLEQHDIYVGRKWFCFIYEKDTKILVTSFTCAIVANEIQKIIQIRDYTK